MVNLGIVYTIALLTLRANPGANPQFARAYVDDVPEDKKQKTLCFKKQNAHVRDLGFHLATRSSGYLCVEFYNIIIITTLITLIILILILIIIIILLIIIITLNPKTLKPKFLEQIP